MSCIDKAAGGHPIWQFAIYVFDYNVYVESFILIVIYTILKKSQAGSQTRV